MEFVGLANYAEVMKSGDFYYSLANTVLIMVIVLVACLVGSVAVALLLNTKSKISGAMTAIAIIPWALPPIVNGIVWRWIFYPGFGFMNKLLYKLGAIESPIQWTTNRYSLVAIIGLVVAWRVIPFCAIVLLSALHSIPDEIYESASIDGAGKLQSFIGITLPLLLPSLAIVVTHSSIAAINVFDEIVSLSGYSYLGQNLILYNYTETFTFLNFGLGSAITYITMLMSGVLGILYIKSMYRESSVAR